MRYLVPVLFFAAAGFVWHYNRSHEDSYLLFPFLDLVPALEGDVEAQIEWSWKLFAGLGAVMLLHRILGDVRRAPNRAPRADVEDDER